MFQIQGSQSSLNNFNSQNNQGNPITVNTENPEQAGNKLNPRQEAVQLNNQTLSKKIPINTNPKAESILNRKFYGTGGTLDIIA